MRTASQGVLRVDYNITDNTRAYVRLARDTEVDPEPPRPLVAAGQRSRSRRRSARTSLAKSAVVNLTSVLSPTATNEIIFSYSKLKLDNGWDDPSEGAAGRLRARTSQNPFGNSQYIPDLVMNFGVRGQHVGGPGRGQHLRVQRVHCASPTTSPRCSNTHAVKIGGIVRAPVQAAELPAPEQRPDRLRAPGATAAPGNEFADILVGRPAQAVVGQPSAVGHFVAWNFEFFAQDSWKVSKNFTLEYGLRVGKWTNNDETNDLGAIFDPSRYDPHAGHLPRCRASTQLNGVAYAHRRDRQRPDRLPSAARACRA